MPILRFSWNIRCLGGSGSRFPECGSTPCGIEFATIRALKRCSRNTLRRLSTVILVVSFAAVARGEWNVVSAQSEFSTSNSVEHRHISVRSEGGAEGTLDLALFSAKIAALRVIDNADGNDELGRAMQRENCVAGVNGGYFDPGFAPIGLRVIDGAVTSPLLRARLLTGVLSASRERGIDIVRIGEFSRKRKLDAAVECGPFVVDLAMRVRGLNDTRSARRTFAAVTRDGKVAVGFCDYVTLAQLGDILASAQVAGEFRVWRAMNLDGGSSSAFWFRRADGSAFSIGEQKNVRDFIGVAPR